MYVVYGITFDDEWLKFSEKIMRLSGKEKHASISDLNVKKEIFSVASTDNENSNDEEEPIEDDDSTDNEDFVNI